MEKKIQALQSKIDSALVRMERKVQPRRPRRKQSDLPAYVPAGQSIIRAPTGRAGSGLVVRRREFISDIRSTGDPFTVQIQEDLNAGNAQLFPWLAPVAVNFERYRFRRLVFEYRSMSGTAVGSTNTALGALVMATNYDVLDPAFTSKQQMEGYQGASSGVPSASFKHVIDCSVRHQTMNALYVLPAAVPAGADPRVYHMGQLQIATAGQQAAATLGELWVEYEVELLQPRIPVPTGLATKSAAFSYTASSGVAWFSDNTPDPNNTLRADLSGNTIRIYQPGRYKVTMWGYVATNFSAPNSMTFNTFVNCSKLTGSDHYGPNGGGHITQSAEVVVDVPLGGGASAVEYAQISLGTANYTGAWNAGYLLVTQVPANITTF